MYLLVVVLELHRFLHHYSRIQNFSQHSWKKALLDLRLDEAIQIWCYDDFVEYFLFLFLGQDLVRSVPKELLDVDWNPIGSKLSSKLQLVL